MDLYLNGRTALVTGSTAGIGLAIAKRLVAEGARVVIVGRSRLKLDKAAATVSAGATRSSAKGDVRTVLADPATAEGAAILMREIPEVEILVNNLGIYEAKPFSSIEDDDWRTLFEINVISGARLARHYFPVMLSRKEGRIIFIASEAALVVPKDMIHYAATKTAQLTIARGLADMTRGTRVTINTVLPGATRSEGIMDYLKSIAVDPEAPAPEMEAEFFRRDRPSSLIQRLIDPEEIATLVAYLSSPLAAAINGAALRADGGIVPTVF